MTAATVEPVLCPHGVEYEWSCQCREGPYAVHSLERCECCQWPSVYQPCERCSEEASSER